ncbi:MAG: acetate kinase [Clostridium sp.]|uniref:acetate/propionate family kinase n=1 Tax=Clostridium sp. TaxID=1506 RepID=UPI002FC92D30
MKVLVINCGSSSLKYQLVDMTNEGVMAKGLVERIGIEGSVLTHKPEGMDKVKIEVPMKDHTDAIRLVLEALVNETHGVIKDMSEISAVGHRVVHGGEKYSKSVLIDDEVMKALEECTALAPLHNPPNLIGINACKDLMGDTPMVAVFDTAFHQTMPDYAFTYALPYELYENNAVRRYGFHGTSHRFVVDAAAEMLGKKVEDIKIVTCHLGNGASCAAIDGGKSVDTSMGFTPLEGLVMGTRCGDIDPAILVYLQNELKLSAGEINDLINKKSGVLGISGISSDFRDIEDAAAEGNKRAQLALDVFHYRVRKYIGAYAAAMGGVDAIVFTAGLGENSPESREEICKGLEFLGVDFDAEKNKFRGKAEFITTESSKVKVIAIPTNEELMIARDTVEIVG